MNTIDYCDGNNLINDISKKLNKNLKEIKNILKLLLKKNYKINLKLTLKNIVIFDFKILGFLMRLFKFILFNFQDYIYKQTLYLYFFFISLINTL